MIREIKKFYKKKAFTLIELLVVVAIIGILAAVGVVAYNGYTSAAKANAVKQNHKQAIKYTKTELIKCTIGEYSIMEGHVICNNTYGVNVFHPPGLGAQKVAEALVNIKAYRAGGYDLGVLRNFKNPYDSKAPGVRSGFGYTVGQVNVSSTGAKNQSNKTNFARLNFMTCLKEPCSGDNIIEEFVYFEE